MSDEGAPLLSSAYKPSALLPISRYRKELLYAIETWPVTIVVGQTGSGKTTQIPQFLFEGGWCSDGKAIAVTQPRRVAVKSVAARVAEEVRCNVGQEVGYSMRFEDSTSEKTKIKFLTDGLLLREALVDPLLSRYSVIMVDEAHERSMSSDVLLSILKKILKKRSDLRVVISSATLQAEDCLGFFCTEAEMSADPPGGSTGIIIPLPGRTYPVDILYLEEAAENYVEATINTILDIHRLEPPGDILVFLPGRDDIERVTEEVLQRSQQDSGITDRLMALPLYAGLSTEQQMAVFDTTPEKTRKVVIATNIAEASVTIDGITNVIDCGYVKLRAYNPATGIDVLATTAVSKASATQRAGRAGRTRPGRCYRLFPETSWDTLADHTPPEIQRSNLISTMLQLKALGVDNLVRFDYFTAPPAGLVERALDTLYSLGALDDHAKLTKPLGLRMAEVAVEPMMAKVLLSAHQFGCTKEILSIAAMTSLQGSLWFHHEGEKKLMETARHKFASEEGDHLTLLNIYYQFVTKGKKDAKWCHENHLNYKSMSQAVSVRNQLQRFLERFGINVDESVLAVTADDGGVTAAEKIRRCLTAGYFSQAAQMQPDGSYLSANGTITLHAHPSSQMFNRKCDWVLFHEIMQTDKKIFIRDITKIEKKWLVEYAPEYYQLKSNGVH